MIVQVSTKLAAPGSCAKLCVNVLDTAGPDDVAIWKSVNKSTVIKLACAGKMTAAMSTKGASIARRQVTIFMIHSLDWLQNAKMLSHHSQKISLLITIITEKVFGYSSRKCQKVLKVNEI